MYHTLKYGSMEARFRYLQTLTIVHLLLYNIYRIAELPASNKIAAIPPLHFDNEEIH